MKNNIDILELEQDLNIEFVDKDLLKCALTHKSYAFEHSELLYNERLEFLGDTVLSLIVSDYLYQIFPDMEEGDLSKNRAKIVAKDSCYNYAGRINLGEYLLLGNGEELSKGRNKKSNLANAFEAILGAMYLDRGFEYTKEFVKRIVLDNPLENTEEDYKSELQEYSQKHFKVIPKYIVVNEEGPAHKKTFTINVIIDDKVFGEGLGETKKQAEQIAAKITLENIK